MKEKEFLEYILKQLEINEDEYWEEYIKWTEEETIQHIKNLKLEIKERLLR